MFYIVTKSNCINCNILKKSLDGTVILHKYVDITNDLDAINHLGSLGYKSLPLIFFNDTENKNIKDILSNENYVGNSFIDINPTNIKLNTNTKIKQILP